MNYERERGMAMLRIPIEQRILKSDEFSAEIIGCIYDRRNGSAIAVIEIHGANRIEFFKMHNPESNNPDDLKQILDVTQYNGLMEFWRESEKPRTLPKWGRHH